MASGCDCTFLVVGCCVVARRTHKTQALIGRCDDACMGEGAACFAVISPAKPPRRALEACAPGMYDAQVFKGACTRVACTAYCWQLQQHAAAPVCEGI